MFPVEPALPAGNYLAADASLKLKVYLSFPLNGVTESTDDTISQPSTPVL